MAEVLIENRLLKKRSRGSGERFMRYSMSEKFETHRAGRQSTLEDGKPRPGRVWNKTTYEVGMAIISLRSRPVATGARRQLYGHKGQLCVRGQRLSALEGPWLAARSMIIAVAEVLDLFGRLTQILRFNLLHPPMQQQPVSHPLLSEPYRNPRPSRQSNA